MPERALHERRTTMCDTVGEEAAEGSAARAASGNELPSAGGALPPRFRIDSGSRSYRRALAKLERHETVTWALAQPLLPLLP